MTSTASVHDQGENSSVESDVFEALAGLQVNDDVERDIAEAVVQSKEKLAFFFLHSAHAELACKEKESRPLSLSRYPSQEMAPLPKRPKDDYDADEGDLSSSSASGMLLTQGLI